jgi:hypothetical protein
MLPTNPQALTAADRTVLDNLKQQGDQINRQTKVLETLIDKVTRQMRSDERLEKGSKKDKTEIKGDTRVKDVPGVVFDKFSDKLNEFIMDMFKENKTKPIDKSKEPSLNNKDKALKDEKYVLKNILNNMVTTSKYQERMLEHTKALQTIADKTFVSINDLKDNLQNAEQPENNTTIEDTEKLKTDKKEKNVKKLKVETEKFKPMLAASNDTAFAAANDETKFTEKKLPDSIGVSVGKNLKPQFDVLGKTLKESLTLGFGKLETAIEGIDTTSLPIPPVIAGAAAPSAAVIGSAALTAGVVTGGALLATGATNALSNATDEQLDMLSADIGSDTGIAAATMLESRKPKLKPKEEQASIRKIDNKIESAESERNAADKKTGGRYTEGRLQRRADKIDTNALKWAQKYYNDPNMQDPDYLSLPKNKEILDYLEKNQNYISKNPDFNLKNVKPKKTDKTSLMQDVTEQNRALTSNSAKDSAPVIINNTNNSVTDSGSSIAFASARPRTTSTSVNDYFRHNARLFDAA